MRNPFNALFIAVYWFIGGYVLMAASRNDQMFVAIMSAIVGTTLYWYVESRFRRGYGVDQRFKTMLQDTPAYLIMLGLILLIIDRFRQTL